MKRKFLYEIIDEIAEAEDFKEVLFSAMDNYKYFKNLLYIIYNDEYNWELDKSTFSTKPRSDRENGGFATAWYDAVDMIKNKLIHNTNLSSRFPDFYAKACRACNKKDVEILNYMLKNRNVPGFKGAKKKLIVEALKEYFNGGSGEDS
jgi:hypothetical protein